MVKVMAAYDVIPEPWRSQHREADQVEKVKWGELVVVHGRFNIPLDLVMALGEETRKAHEVLVKARGGSMRREAAEDDFVDQACKECGGEIESSEGRRATKCVACKTKPKPAVLCRDCDAELPVRVGPGRSPVRCPPCREKVTATAQEAKEQAVASPGECKDCGGPIAPTGKRGRPPTRCAPCRGLA